MPRAKSKRKPRPRKNNRRRKSARRSRIGRPSRPLTLSRYFFKRKITGTLSFANIGEGGLVPTGMGSSANVFYNVPADLGTIGSVVLWKVRLVDLPDNAEFTNGLFMYYKINAMKVKILPQSSIAVTGTNNQITCYTMPYDYKLDLEGASLTEGKCLQIQSAKTTQIVSSTGNGRSFYTRCRVLNDLDAGAVTDTKNWRSPVWLPASAGADSNEVEHYGLMQRFQPNLAAVAWPTTQSIKIIITCYLEFKGVA